LAPDPVKGGGWNERRKISHNAPALSEVKSGMNHHFGSRHTLSMKILTATEMLILHTPHD
jgi:hypothetical protein